MQGQRRSTASNLTDDHRKIAVDARVIQLDDSLRRHLRNLTTDRRRLNVEERFHGDLPEVRDSCGFVLVWPSFCRSSSPPFPRRTRGRDRRPHRSTESYTNEKRG